MVNNGGWDWLCWWEHTDDNDNPLISIHAISGTVSKGFRTMRIIGKVRKKVVDILIESGNTHKKITSYGGGIWDGNSLRNTKKFWSVRILFLQNLRHFLLWDPIITKLYSLMVLPQETQGLIDTLHLEKHHWKNCFWSSKARFYPT